MQGPTQLAVGFGWQRGIRRAILEDYLYFQSGPLTWVQPLAH